MVVVSVRAVLAPPFFVYCIPDLGSFTLTVPAVMAVSVSGMAFVTEVLSILQLTL